MKSFTGLVYSLDLLRICFRLSVKRCLHYQKGKETSECDQDVRQGSFSNPYCYLTSVKHCGQLIWNPWKAQHDF